GCPGPCTPLTSVISNGLGTKPETPVLAASRSEDRYALAYAEASSITPVVELNFITPPTVHPNLDVAGGDHPAVAFGTNHAAVAYQRGFDVFATLVSTEGTVGTELQLTRNGACRDPAVTWVGDDVFLVAWVDNSVNGATLF